MPTTPNPKRARKPPSTTYRGLGNRRIKRPQGKAVDNCPKGAISDRGKTAKYLFDLVIWWYILKL
jgi:hypothetical protein